MYDFKKVEEEIRKFWENSKISDKVRNNSLKKKEKYYFMDGPPYATGHIHMGTALNKILKDIAIRSKRMQGFSVFDKPGYDTHGMPIEYKVENEIGVKTKQDIENYGVKKFIEKCREFATSHLDIMNEEFKDLGVWMDWKNPYITLNKEFIETNWWTFKKAYEKNLLYLGKYPIHACPRCETAVAYNEIEYGTKEDNSIYVKFPISGEKNKFLIIWTTTPWTLPGNTAVMVHPDYEYVEAEVEEEIWVIAKELVEEIMNKVGKKYKIKKTFKGKELEGKEYENPLSKNLNLETKNAYKVILSGRYVDLESGTGLVHAAPGHGKEDFDASKKYNIDIISPVNINGKMTNEAGKYQGKKAREVDSEIIEDLEKDGFLVYTEKYSHDYPVCWRCASPLIMVSVPQWFFRISSIHDKLLKENEKINWIPHWAKSRMKAWLEGISDWPISRERYWGTPLPIWICKKCDEKVVVGSVKELEKLSGQNVKEVHKPDIDKITINCKCGGKMERVPEVLDVWFDSGVASWAALNYPEKKDLFNKYWPADLNLEGTDQFRGWWNSQLILSVIVFDKKPFDTIYVHGMVLGLGKTKMSKSKGNFVSPQEVIEKFGRDALRYYLSLIQPGDNITYDEKYFKEINKFFTVLINIKNLIKSDFGLEFTDKINTEKIEDKWIISKLNNLKKEVNDNYNKYLFYKNTQLISDFVLQDVSRTYIQIVRDRISNNDKKVGKILNKILSEIITLSAPVIPHLTDYIYKEMNGKEESIHLLEFPRVDKKNVDKKLEEDFEGMLQVIEKGLAERDKEKIGLKWPLTKAVISSPYKFEKELQDIISKQLNVKKIEMKQGKEISVKLDTKLTPELEAEGFAREVSRHIQSFRKKLGLNKDDKVNIYLIVDEDFKNMLKKQRDFIKERTNSKEFNIVTTGEKENFKNKTDFRVKNRKGEIAITD